MGLYSVAPPSRLGGCASEGKAQSGFRGIPGRSRQRWTRILQNHMGRTGVNLRSIIVVLAALSTSCGGGGDQRPAENHGPLALHPQNPHYFTYRGRPTIL